MRRLALLAALALALALLAHVQPRGLEFEPEPELVLVPTPSVEVRVLEWWAFPRVTYYNAVPWQTNSDPFTSACGPNREGQVAVSRDLFRSELSCGDVISVWLEGEHYGDFVVWDTMHPRFVNTLDILADGVLPWGLTHGHAVLVQRRTP